MQREKEYSWLEVIKKAMESLGGHAKYEDLYDKIKEMGLRDFSSLKDMKAPVRGCLQQHSSDTTVYKGLKGDPNKDIFYSVEGLGKGHWGLRNFDPHDNDVDITEDDEGFPEGKKKLRTHICRDRNYKVIREAKRRYKDKHEKVICEICRFDFEETYGEIGKDFIEGHHIIPVSELNEGDKTKVEDIVLVCSNCHKMLHRKRPWLTPCELAQLIK